MADQRHVRLFRNGRYQAIRIPVEFELPGDEAVMHRDGDRLVIATPGAGTLVAAAPREPAGGADMSVAIRPEKIRLSRRGAAGEHVTVINQLDGVITDVCYLGGATTYKVKLDAGGMVQASLANSARRDADAYGVGQPVVASFAPGDCVVLER